MNEFVAVLFGIAIVVMIAYDKYNDVKDKKAYKVAQEEVKAQIAALEKKLASLRK